MRACPVCSNSTDLTYLWNTQIVRCPECGLGYVDRLPTLEELEAIYSAEYFRGRTAYTDYEADKAGTQHHFRHRIRLLRQYKPDGDLFEAGCAYGFFLEIAREHWNVRGIDISEAAIEYARNTLKLPVEREDFESHPPKPDSYDVVAMWDVIEHLYDPMLAVQKSAEALRPGGILAITTADLDAYLPRIQKRGWRMIIPAHLYYFSRRSITHLLKNHGLNVVHFSHVGYYRSLRQMSQIITWNKPESRWRQNLQRTVERLPLMNTYVPLNLYDIMFVIAQKD
jgi:2-polyprenyl-3-methyl-5-hydroxy-6-metoxy-1,4-benzoquinol methylase